jgi:pyruvate formate lyase activating enzyme
MQQAFSLCVLKMCRQEGLHTAIETAGCCRWEDLEELLPWLDLVIMDVKLMNDKEHRAATGAPNRRILQNALRLSEQDVPLLLRTPVVPGVNDTPAAIGEIAEFVRDLPNLLYYELMPFHRMAEGKYRSLGLTYRASGLEAPAREVMESLAQHARDLGVPEVKVG